MALSITQRNVLAFVLLVGVFLLFQLGGDRYSRSLFEYVPWAQSVIVLAVVLFVFGAVSFFAFVGAFWVRTSLTAAVPIVTQAVLELVWSSGPGYEQILLMLAIPYALLFFLGAVLVGGPYLVWRDSRHRAI